MLGFSFAAILRIGFGPKNVICIDNTRTTGPRELWRGITLKCGTHSSKALPLSESNAPNRGSIFKRHLVSGKYLDQKKCVFREEL